MTERRARRPWRIVTLIVAALIAVGVALYAWYVRGVGVQARIVQAPGYTWAIREGMPEPRTEVAAAEPTRAATRMMTRCLTVDSPVSRW